MGNLVAIRVRHPSHAPIGAPCANPVSKEPVPPVAHADGPDTYLGGVAPTRPCSMGGHVVAGAASASTR